MMSELDLEWTLEGEKITFRKYLKLLLETLWKEGEGFSGKRPFGNSGWEHELYHGLIEIGSLEGVWNEEEEGYEDYDTIEGDKIILRMIRSL